MATPRPDLSEVLSVIEHWLQHGTGTHPHGSYADAARAMEPGDAQRALVSIGEAMDRAATGLT